MSYSPEPGGPTGQYGIKFQNSVAALILAKLLAEETVVPEPFGILGKIKAVQLEGRDAVDDIIVDYSRGRREYIQVKANISPSSSSWVALWQNFYKQYVSPGFVTGKNGDLLTLSIGTVALAEVGDFNNLLGRVADKLSFKDWEDSLSQSQKKSLDQLRAMLKLDGESLLKFCKHVRVWTVPYDPLSRGGESFDNRVGEILRGIADPIENTFSALSELVSKKAPIRGTVEYSELVERLALENIEVSHPAEQEVDKQRRRHQRKLEFAARAEILQKRTAALRRALDAEGDPDEKERLNARLRLYEEEGDEVANLVSALEGVISIAETVSDLPSASAPGGPMLGPYVHLMCDRGPQEEQFEISFVYNADQRAGLPQIYIIPGPDDENHNSLVERFCVTMVKDYVDAKIDLYRASIKFEKMEDDWPSTGSLENRKYRLVLSLFKQFEDKGIFKRKYPEEFTASHFRELLASDSLKDHFIIVRHEIKVWDKETKELIEWYRDFWDEVKRGEVVGQGAVPQCLIFLNVEYPPETARAKKKGSKSGDRNPIVALKRLSDPPGCSSGPISKSLQCTCIGLDELPCVRKEHVTTWFERHGIGGNDLNPDRICDEIFRTKRGALAKCRPMREVESKLKEVSKHLTRGR